MSTLFTPMNVGDLHLQHRVVGAPMTRLRSQPDDTPSDMMAEWYGQRASDGGLQIAESSAVSPAGRAYLGAPGLYADAHIAGWKKVTDAVHAKGGYLIAQIYDPGRVGHVENNGGVAPAGASVVPFDNHVITADGLVDGTPHRAYETAEIPGVIELFRQAADRALQAGFDGIELHGANGYLVDQFLQDGTNRRTDKYGGPLENRVRFVLETLNALIAVWGSRRVGLRFSPSGEWGDISDTNPERTFGYLAEQLNPLQLAYLHVIEPRIKGDDWLHEGQEPVASSFLRKKFTGPIIAAGGFDREGADAILDRGEADLVAFGRWFASNPDLPIRLRKGLPLAAYDRQYFWGGTELGYIDYPIYGE